METIKNHNEQRRLALVEENLKERERQFSATLAHAKDEQKSLVTRITAEAHAAVAAQKRELDAMAAQLTAESERLRATQQEHASFAQKMAQLEVECLVRRRSRIRGCIHIYIQRMNRISRRSTG
jgi:hypothetical protein